MHNWFSLFVLNSLTPCIIRSVRRLCVHAFVHNSYIVID